MAENIYNYELIELLYNKTRKAKRNLQLIQESQQQLKVQMINLGYENYWNKKRLLEEKLKQLKRIHEEFSKERQILCYKYEFLGYGRIE